MGKIMYLKILFSTTTDLETPIVTRKFQNIGHQMNIHFNLFKLYNGAARLIPIYNIRKTIKNLFPKLVSV